MHRIIDLGKKITVEQLTCLRCSHKWWPRIEENKVVNPKTCPTCRSPYWNKPVERKATSQAKKKK